MAKGLTLSSEQVRAEQTLTLVLQLIPQATMLPSRQAKRTPARGTGSHFLPGDGDTRQLPALAAGLCSYPQPAGHLHAS